MTREQLKHVLRAAAAIAQERSFVVVGVLLKERMVDLDTLLSRIAVLDPSRADISKTSAWARRRAQEAAA